MCPCRFFSHYFCLFISFYFDLLGIVLVAEKRVNAALLDIRSATEKLFKVDAHICCAVAGITSDANNLIETARLESQRYLYAYQELAPVEQLVQKVCSVKQSYTQFGGLRPFGVSFIFAGWDHQLGYQLYHTDPSGNYAGWSAKAIGSGATDVVTLLKDELKQEDAKELTLVKAKPLAARLLAKAMSAVNLSVDKIEMMILTADEKTGEVTSTVVPTDELKVLVEDVNDLLDEEKAKEAASDI